MRKTWLERVRAQRFSAVDALERAAHDARHPGLLPEIQGLESFVGRRLRVRELETMSAWAEGEWLAGKPARPMLDVVRDYARDYDRAQGITPAVEGVFRG